jgi:DUF1365 family protein
MTASCVYEGRVRHRRLDPVHHELGYPLALMYLDLAELPGVFDGHPLWSARRPAPAWFRRSDYLGPADVPLDESVRALVEERTGERPEGPVRLLTQLRYLGYAFNPVSFYFCFDAAGEHVRAVVAEVTNTPWGERHAYVLDRPADDAGRVMETSFAKAFHVSPFMGMNHTYDWRLTEPGDQLVVHIDSERAGEIVFDATLSLERRPLASSVLVRHPAQTMQIVTQIYAHAVRTAAKGGRYHPNPSGAPLAGPARRRHARSSRERPTSSGGIPCPRPAPIPAAEPEPVGARR